MLNRLLQKLGGFISGFRVWDTASIRYTNVKTAARMLVTLLLCGLLNGFRVWGTYKFVFRDASGTIVAVAHAPNAVVNVGLNYILNVALGGGTQITSWYLMLVSNGGTPTFAAADTHASHAWTEFTDYSQATRPAWTPVASTVQSITNTSASVFSITGSGTLKGMALASLNTKGSTAGGSNLLFSEAAFAEGIQTVSNGGTVQATYTCNAAST